MASLDTLNGAKSKRYRHAARHILECQALDPSIADYAALAANGSDASVRALNGVYAAISDRVRRALVCESDELLRHCLVGHALALLLAYR